MPHLPFWAGDDAGPQTESDRPRNVFGSLDVHEYLVRHPAATYFVRMEGSELIDEGVHDGDVLVVNRSREPKLHNIVILVHAGEMYARKIMQAGNGRVVSIDGRNIGLANTEVWGIVCGVVRKL